MPVAGEVNYTNAEIFASETLTEIRKRAEIVADAIIAFLDAVDGDPDAEPSLGSHIADLHGLDAEADDCDWEEDNPREDDGLF